MDLVIFTLIAVVIVWRVLEAPEETVVGVKSEIVPEETVNRVAKLNEDFYDDPEAFMDIAHSLGFPKEG